MENETLQLLEQAVREFERSVLPPKLVRRGDVFVYKYTERTIQQALVLKSFRVVSGLRAIQALYESKLHQEQHIIERIVDEVTEDIEFLVLAIVDGMESPLHKKYLDAFFFDSGMQGDESHPWPPKRSKILKHIYGRAHDVYGHEPYSDDVYESYGMLSGFVHANGPNIMDSFLGDPPRLQIQYETNDTERKTFLNTFHIRISRGCIALQLIAAVFGIKALVESLESHNVYWNKQCLQVG